MIDFDGAELQKEFNEVFGSLLVAEFASKENKEAGYPVSNYRPVTIKDLNARQLWWLTKFAKHVRGRCRNNSAFNNFMNRNFKPAYFREVPKEYEGKHYMGLEIQVGNNTVGDKEAG